MLTGIEMWLKYPKNEIMNYGVEVVSVPEFRKANGLKENVTKLDLLSILLNMGTVDNRAAVENFGLSQEQMMTVLQREMSPKDFDFAQGIWDMYATLVPRLKSVYKEMTGGDIELVAPSPFTAFNKEFRGGYFPLFRRINSQLKEIDQTLQDLTQNGDIDPDTFPNPAFEGVIRNPHYRERTGGDYVVDLDINNLTTGLDNMIHALTMAVPVRDTLNLFKNERIANNFKALVGERKFNIFTDNIRGLTNSVHANSMKLHSKNQKFLQNLYSNIEGAMAVSYISGSLTSAFMSGLAYPQIMQVMGVNNARKYLSRSALKFTNPLNMNKFKKMYDLAAEIDPSLNLHRQGLDDYISSTLTKGLPKKRAIPSKMYNLARRGQERLIEFTFADILGSADAVIKVHVMGAAYQMYLDGNAPGHSFSDVHDGKTELQVHNDAKAYVSQFLESTTMRAGDFDKAVIQKNPLLKTFTRFWNEMRGGLNNVIQQGGRNTGIEASEIIRYAKQGDFAKANASLGGAVDNIAKVIFIGLLSNALYNYIKGENPFETPENEGEEIDIDHLPKFLAYRLTDGQGMFKTGVDVFGQFVPVVKDIAFTAEGNIKWGDSSRGVSTPGIAGLTAIARTGSAMSYMWSTMDDMSLVEAAEGLTPGEIKSMLQTSSILARGIPVKPILYAMERMEEAEMNNEPIVPAADLVNQNFIDNLDRFIEKFGPEETEEERFKRLLGESQETQHERFKRLLNRSKDMDTAVESAQQLRNNLQPLPEGRVLSKHGFEIIKYAESNGQWNAQPPVGSAFGLYQFTEDTWEWVASTPEGRREGLTSANDGRLSMDTREQEIAMRILTKYNVTSLRRDNVPISLDSIYFAHHFGTKHASKIYGEDVSVKDTLPTSLITKQVEKQNPKTGGLVTVGDMRRYIRNAIERGRKAYEDQEGIDIAPR